MIDFPRRGRIECMKPAELKIRDAIIEIETMGCDERLSRAQTMLSDAQRLVADVIDEREAAAIAPAPKAAAPEQPAKRVGVVTDPNELDATLGPDGMQRNYLVLSDEERAKGFVRPVRVSYRHVGTPAPRYPLRDLTSEEKERTKVFPYVKYEDYPPNQNSAVVGRFWTQAQLDGAGKGCGSVTTMSRAIAETYARNPYFYGATFCVACCRHIPVGIDGEFVWDGTDERVGT